MSGSGGLFEEKGYKRYLDQLLGAGAKHTRGASRKGIREALIFVDLLTFCSLFWFRNVEVRHEVQSTHSTLRILVSAQG